MHFTFVILINHIKFNDTHTLKNVVISSLFSPENENFNLKLKNEY